MIKKWIKRQGMITVREQILWVIIAFGMASTAVTLAMRPISELSFSIILERAFVFIISLISVVLVYKYNKF